MSEHDNGPQGPENERMEVFTSVGATTTEGKPFVIIEWGEKHGQLTPAQAVEEGMGLITAAIESQRDASLVRWGEADGIPLDQIGVILQRTREHRDQIELVAQDHQETQAARQQLRKHDPRGGDDDGRADA